MRKKSLFKPRGVAREALISIVLALAVILIVVQGCGKTDGGSAGSASSTQFEADSGNSGTLLLTVSNTSINVGETSSFTVTVKDENGNPVSQINIACDTEQGLALIDPNTGFSITDAFGSISGVVGCVSPGSFQMACRLPIGANKRKFVTIKCSGPVPPGFTGFEGAGGGGLGTGGSSETGAGTNSVRLVAAGVVDNGDPVGQTLPLTNEIDTTQDICQTSSSSSSGASPTATVELEPFFDAFAVFEVVNDSSELVTFTSYSFVVEDGISSGVPFTSGNIALASPTEVAANGGDETFFAIFASVGGTGKVFAGSSTSVGSGVKKVTFTLNGKKANGGSISISGSITVVFADFDNCSS
ncbi:MAG: hypothetical protein D6780_03995 [Candidatus Dadabacteria bacterium]|nr:MAG: hypothetical protein D6780_03995 [Candidatus Dadabacteria bacterium]